MARRIGVIVPALDEEACIPALVSELRATIEAHALDADVVIVDDGSRDGTFAMATEQAQQWPRLRVVSHPRQLGKTEALLTGAAATQARALVLFDADLQHSPEEIPKLLAALDQGADMVTGFKIGHYEKARSSRIYNWLSRALFRVPSRDLNSIKAFRREVLEAVHLRHDWHRYFAVLAHLRGFVITEQDVQLCPRRHGRSKYTSPWRLVVACVDLVFVATLALGQSVQAAKRVARKPAPISD